MSARAYRVFFSFVLVLASASAAFGQSVINGRVVDPQNNPVPDLQVLLHAVNESRGMDVDTDTTAADGTFSVSAGVTAEDAVYFVAVMWNGQLYMGDLLRAPFPLEQEYVVRVGVNPVDVSAEAAETQITPEEAEQNRSRGAIVIVVAGAVIAGLLGYGLRRRPAAQRRWLVELARLEDDLSTTPDSPDLQKRRAELRARLKAPKSG